MKERGVWGGVIVLFSSFPSDTKALQGLVRVPPTEGENNN
jgi:hypothetical protein